MCVCTRSLVFPKGLPQPLGPGRACWRSHNHLWAASPASFWGRWALGAAWLRLWALQWQPAQWRARRPHSLVRGQGIHGDGVEVAVAVRRRVGRRRLRGEVQLSGPGPRALFVATREGRALSGPFLRAGSLCSATSCLARTGQAFVMAAPGTPLHPQNHRDRDSGPDSAACSV